MPVDIPTGSFDVIREEFIDDRMQPDPEIDRERARPDRMEERRTRQVQYQAFLSGGKWYTNPFRRGEAYDSSIDAINAQRMADIVNDDTVTIDKEMVEVINDPETKVVDGQITRRLPTGRDVIRRSGQFRRDLILPRTGQDLAGKRRKLTRKPSRYRKELSKQLKNLKKKHPRTIQTKLMSKAHAATRKILGMPRKKKK